MKTLSMRRFLTWWLLGTQLPALIALWIAQGMASGAAKKVFDDLPTAQFVSAIF